MKKSDPDHRLSTHLITRSMIRKVRQEVVDNPPEWLRPQIEEARTQPMLALKVEQLLKLDDGRED